MLLINFTDVPENVKNKPWFRRVDCSKLLTECLVTYANNEPISPLLNGRKELFEKIALLKSESDNT